MNKTEGNLSSVVDVTQNVTNVGDLKMELEVDKENTDKSKANPAFNTEDAIK